MANHSSAQVRQDTPHAANSTTSKPISDALRYRAQLLISDRTIDAGERTLIRYALEIDDATRLAELVRRADAGEPIIDDSHLTQANEELSTEEKLERLAEMICQAGDQAAALLVLMSTLENSTEPKALAHRVKHVAFTRCGELNCYGMVDTQIASIERELFANTIGD